MTQDNRSQAGFTLIEAMIAMLVLAIFMAGAMSMVVSNNKIALQTQSKLNATKAVRGGLDRLQPMLRRADRILLSTNDIPAGVRSLVGHSFFQTSANYPYMTGNNAVVLRIPVFDKATGSLSSQDSYAVLHYNLALKTLNITYAMLRPDGSVDYKRKDEVVARDANPPTSGGTVIPWLNYFDSAGTAVATPTAANIDDIVRVRLTMAVKDSNTVSAQTTQVSTEIRLANRTTASSVNFVVYNPNNATRTLNAIEIGYTGNTAAPTLTKVTFGSVAVWTGSQVLTASPMPRITPSPPPSMAATSTTPSTLWFASASSIAGTYTVNCFPDQGNSLSTTFTYTASY